MSTSRPRRGRDPASTEYPRRGRGAAATSSPRTLYVAAAAAASPRKSAETQERLRAPEGWDAPAKVVPVLCEVARLLSELGEADKAAAAAAAAAERADAPVLQAKAAHAAARCALARRDPQTAVDLLTNAPLGELTKLARAGAVCNVRTVCY